MLLATHVSGQIWHLFHSICVNNCGCSHNRRRFNNYCKLFVSSFLDLYLFFVLWVVVFLITYLCHAMLNYVSLCLGFVKVRHSHANVSGIMLACTDLFSLCLLYELWYFHAWLTVCVRGDLALRVLPAVTRLTVYRWLHILYCRRVMTRSAVPV